MKSHLIILAIFVVGACKHVNAEMVMVLRGEPDSSIVSFELSGSDWTKTGSDSLLAGTAFTITDGYDPFPPEMPRDPGLNLLSGGGTIRDVHGVAHPIAGILAFDSSDSSYGLDGFGVFWDGYFDLRFGELFFWEGSGTVDLAETGLVFGDLNPGMGVGQAHIFSPDGPLPIWDGRLIIVRDTDADGLLDLLDALGFDPNATGTVRFEGPIQDLDGASQLTNLQELVLADNEISSIERGDFEGLSNLQELWLNSNQIVSIERGAFEGLSNLQELVLKFNQIKSIESGNFEGLSNLQRLSLDGNHLTSIDSGDFDGLADLQVLRLPINQITSIESGDFEGLTSLQHLNLGDNEITGIERGDFDGLPNLQGLNLRDNQVTSIESEDFAGLPSLKNLSLFGNQIEGIESGAFSWAVELEALNLRINPLEELNFERARFESLDTLQVDRKTITSIVLDDAKLSLLSYGMVLGETKYITEASVDGLTFTDEAPSDLSSLLDTQTLTNVTVDPWLYDRYADDFEAFDEQEGKTVTITPKDCNGDGQISILDTSCISVNRVDNLLEDYGTVRGDADGHGGVDFADFLILQDNFGQSPAEYTDGDFDVDGQVGFSDFLVLSGNFGQGGDFTGSTVAVPEPSSLALLLLGMMGTWRFFWAASASTDSISGTQLPA